MKEQHPGSAAGLMTLEEAVEFLKISRASVYLLMKNGELAYVQIGGRRRFRVTDLTAFVERRLVAAR